MSIDVLAGLETFVDFKNEANLNCDSWAFGLQENERPSNLNSSIRYSILNAILQNRVHDYYFKQHAFWHINSNIDTINWSHGVKPLTIFTIEFLLTLNDAKVFKNIRYPTYC
jgi:hypothetical protein